MDRPNNSVRSEDPRAKRRKARVLYDDDLEWTEDEVMRLRALAEDHDGSRSELPVAYRAVLTYFSAKYLFHLTSPPSQWSWSMNTYQSWTKTRSCVANYAS